MYYKNAPVSPPNSENKKKARSDDMSIDYDKAIQEDIKEMQNIRNYLKTHKLTWREKIKLIQDVARRSNEKIRLALNDKDV